MFCLSGLGSLWQICRHQGLSGIHSKLEGYFFPWHFAAETAPIRKLRSVTLPNMSFLLPLYFISTGKEGRGWPMRPGQWERRNGRRPLLAVEKLIDLFLSTEVSLDASFPAAHKTIFRGCLRLCPYLKENCNLMYKWVTVLYMCKEVL